MSAKLPLADPRSETRLASCLRQPGQKRWQTEPQRGPQNKRVKTDTRTSRIRLRQLLRCRGDVIPPH
jgi:hypothetical protein